MQQMTRKKKKIFYSALHKRRPEALFRYYYQYGPS